MPNAPPDQLLHEQLMMSVLATHRWQFALGFIRAIQGGRNLSIGILDRRS
jgi:hypothetical protein